MRNMNFIKKEWLNFWADEDGSGAVEIILILVVLVALVIVFREEITGIVDEAFSTIGTDADTINKGISIDEE